MAQARVYIAIPSARDWKPHFGASLCGLVRKATQDRIDIEMNAMMGTSVLPKAREGALRHAIALGFTHLLFLDDDMAFPPSLLSNFLAAEKDVVGVNYVNKNPQGPLPMTHALDGQSVSSKDKIGLEEIGWLGFGAVLISLASVKDIEAPLFEMRWMAERNDFIGEDYYFCGKVRAHGVKIYVDHDISAKMGHVGDFVFREAA